MVKAMSGPRYEALPPDASALLGKPPSAHPVIVEDAGNSTMQSSVNSPSYMQPFLKINFPWNETCPVMPWKETMGLLFRAEKVHNDLPARVFCYPSNIRYKLLHLHRQMFLDRDADLEQIPLYTHS